MTDGELDLNVGIEFGLFQPGDSGNDQAESEDTSPDFAPPVCRYCGEYKVEDTTCHGNDQCIYGPDGGPAMCCEGWSGMCCKCGASYAIGQM